jgi:hypothetical protein
MTGRDPLAPAELPNRGGPSFVGKPRTTGSVKCSAETGICAPEWFSGVPNRKTASAQRETAVLQPESAGSNPEAKVLNRVSEVLKRKSAVPDRFSEPSVPA